MSVWLVDAIGEESIDRLVSRKRFIFRFPLARAIPPENSEINSSIVICFSLLFLFNLESKSRIVRFSVERFFFIDRIRVSLTLLTKKKFLGKSLEREFVSRIVCLRIVSWSSFCSLFQNDCRTITFVRRGIDWQKLDR